MTMRTGVHEMKISNSLTALGAAIILSTSAANAATVVLYDQDFESPAGYVNDGGDVNIRRQVNTLYGGQPAGFSFAQAFTVETLNISGSDRGTGTAAFGTGYSDPSGKAGNFLIGMLSNVQNDLLGLSFNVGSLPFFNLGIDITSIDLSTFSGPFVPAGAAGIPTFQFTLYDNPSGAVTTGGGTVLDQKTLTGTESAKTVVDFTTGVIALSTDGNTNGNVTLQIDLLPGSGYAGFDNMRITASDEAGGGIVPLPGAVWMFLSALGGLSCLAGWRRKRAAA